MTKRVDCNLYSCFVYLIGIDALKALNYEATLLFPLWSRLHFNNLLDCGMSVYDLDTTFLFMLVISCTVQIQGNYFEGDNIHVYPSYTTLTICRLGIKGMPTVSFVAFK